MGDERVTADSEEAAADRHAHLVLPVLAISKPRALLLLVADPEVRVRVLAEPVVQPRANPEDVVVILRFRGGGTEGTVGVAVTVGPDGKVSQCSVSSSSGSDVLDSAACDGMRRYAQFDPALDEDGRPTSSNWSTRIVYRLN